MIVYDDYDDPEDEEIKEEQKKKFIVWIEACLVPQDEDILLGNLMMHLERRDACFGVRLCLKDKTLELMLKGRLVAYVSRKDPVGKRMGWRWLVFPKVWNAVNDSKPIQVGTPISFNFEVEIGEATNIHLHKLVSG